MIMACTTILIGKNASYDGSTLVARNEDSGAGAFNAKKFVVVQPEEQPRIYRSVLSHVTIELPSNPMRYTCYPNAIQDEGIWGAFGVNEVNVSMTATETLTSNERVLGADPMAEFIPAKGKEGEDNYIPEQIGGIGEEDMVTLVLPYIKNAREGVLRLGNLLTRYGTYEMNGIAFQDEKEIWWLETIGGHHWIARRVPDDAYVIMPNQLGIDHFDLKDAFGEQREYLCSSDLKEFIRDNHLDLSFDGNLNPQDAFGSHSDADHVYNTPRAWILQRYFNPHSNSWDGVDADYRPDSDDMPWCRVAERKITVEDIKYAMSHHFQGTPYDPYQKHGDSSLKGALRPIGINRNNVLGCVQIRPYMPDEIKSIEWIALGSNVFNAMAPFYSNIDKVPDYLGNTTERVTTEDFYWTNRMIAALADPHYTYTSNFIEQYQNKVQSTAREILNKYDKEFLEQKYTGKKASALCEQANEKMARMLKLETEDLLDKVLFEASCHMKNSFSRSDA
ncbi:putative dipeptidase A [Peptostreptococcaceae bacterium oral taxon 113 str. W5053]|nr:putative dipeptidase A [Peptostreptococcaceae bacterium oral taxon 113 str. W5053]